MNAIISSENLKKAAVVTILVYLANNFTATQSPIVRGVAMFAAAALALPLASKI